MPGVFNIRELVMTPFRPLRLGKRLAVSALATLLVILSSPSCVYSDPLRQAERIELKRERQEARREARKQQTQAAAATPSHVSSAKAPVPKVKGGVYVDGNRFMSDGAPFTLKGAQILAFVAPEAYLKGEMIDRHASYGPAQLSQIKAYGVNTLRFMVSQAGLDPTSAIYSSSYAEEMKSGIRSALTAGFRAIVALNWERHSGTPIKQPLPGENSIRVWRWLAEQFKGDERILFEIYNEPGPAPTPRNWQLWLKGGSFPRNPDGQAVGMQSLITAIRGAGANNVIIIPGLQLEKSLAGIPIPYDPINNFAFGVHTPDLDMGPSGWDRDFGYLTSRYPVVLTEWVAGSKSPMCSDNAEVAGPQFLSYVKAHNIHVSSRAWEDPQTSFVNFKCANSGAKSMSTPLGGPGKLLGNYFRTGQVRE